jgi:uncharacterized protein (DUF849 family)
MPVTAAARKPSTGRFTRASSRAFVRKWTFRFIRPLIGEAVARGGHIRVGLEDAPLGTRVGNPALVEEAVQIVRDLGAEPASAADLRLALAALAEA